MMTSSLRRIAIAGLLAAASVGLFVVPSAAIGFTVHGFERGENIELTNGRPLRNAQFNVTLGDRHGTSFCVDLDTRISRATDEVRGVLPAYTTVQAALWKGIYGGGVVNVASLSSGAQRFFREILGNWTLASGPAVIVELRGHRDQVFSNPVPEPTAAMVFGIGLLIAGSALRRHSR